MLYKNRQKYAAWKNPEGVFSILGKEKKIFEKAYSYQLQVIDNIMCYTEWVSHLHTCSKIKQITNMEHRKISLAFLHSRFIAYFYTTSIFEKNLKKTLYLE